MSKNLTKFKKVIALKDLFWKEQKLITKGKTYNIIRGGWRNLFIIDNAGDEMQLHHDNPSFRYIVN
jgi:hypothetical protein